MIRDSTVCRLSLEPNTTSVVSPHTRPPSPFLHMHYSGKLLLCLVRFNSCMLHSLNVWDPAFNIITIMQHKVDGVWRTHSIIFTAWGRKLLRSLGVWLWFLLYPLGSHPHQCCLVPVMFWLVLIIRCRAFTILGQTVVFRIRTSASAWINLVFWGLLMKFSHFWASFARVEMYDDMFTVHMPLRRSIDVGRGVSHSLLVF